MFVSDTGLTQSKSGDEINKTNIYKWKYLDFLHPRVRNIITISFKRRPSSNTFLVCLFLLSYFKHYMFRL